MKKIIGMAIFLSLLTGSAFSQEAVNDIVSYALLAGCSKGIGYGIAEALAKRKFNLILVARHRDSLNAAKAKLESVYRIHVETLQYDLSKKETAEEIAKWCTEKNI